MIPTIRARLALLALEHLPLILFSVVFLAFGLLAPRFLELQSFENIVKQASYIGIVAVGMTVVLLTAGIDLSVGANMLVSAACAGMAMQAFRLPVWMGLLVCLLVGLAFGAVNAFAIARLGIKPFIATLATLVAGRGVGLLLTGSRAIAYPESVVQAGSVRVLGWVPLPIVLFALVVAGTHVLLQHTPLGRRIYAVGTDVEAAKKAGIATGRVLAVTYLICGVLAALGGFVSVMQIGIVNPGFGEGREFEAIAAAVLGGASLFGGRGRVFPGTVLGTVLIQMVGIGLVFTQVDLYAQPLVVAAIIFLAVALDSLRTRQLARLERRRIRVSEAVAATPG